jgi:hypothetical protein
VLVGVVDEGALIVTPTVSFSFVAMTIPPSAARRQPARRRYYVEREDA